MISVSCVDDCIGPDLSPAGCGGNLSSGGYGGGVFSPAGCNGDLFSGGYDWGLPSGGCGGDLFSSSSGGGGGDLPNVDVGPLRSGASAGEKKSAATYHLASLPQCAVRIWTDGSVEGGVGRGGAGVHITWADGQEEELYVPAGRHCYSYSVEMLL